MSRRHGPAGLNGIENVGRQQQKQLHKELEEGKTMTVFEWKITDLGNEEHGYIWIASDNFTGFDGTVVEDYRVYIDPTNLDGHAKEILSCDLMFDAFKNELYGLELPEDDPAYGRILWFWKRQGKPRIDRKAPGYGAPWFPWLEAGFTAEERDSIIAEPSTERIEVQHE